MTEIVNLLSLLEATADDEDSRLAERLRGILDSGDPLPSSPSGLALKDHTHPATYDGIFNVRDYGAVGDGIIDDGPAIQAAIDAADGPGNLHAGTAYFPPGVYSTEQELEWKFCNLVGAFPTSSVRVIWNGPDGGTCLTKTANSFGELSGIYFRPGSTMPGRWVWLKDKLVDKLLLIRDIHFASCSIAAVEAGYWINFHMQDIRWDMQDAGWAIRLTPGPGQNLSSFTLDRFTYDHAMSSSAAGFIRVDNTANSSNLGTFRVSNGRMEINTPWVGEQAILSYKCLDRTATDGPMPRSVGWHLSDMTFDVTRPGRMDNAVVLYRDTNDMLSSEALMLTNFRSQKLSQIFGGAWPPNMPRPNGNHYFRLEASITHLYEALI